MRLVIQPRGVACHSAVKENWKVGSMYLPAFPQAVKSSNLYKQPRGVMRQEVIDGLA